MRTLLVVAVVVAARTTGAQLPDAGTSNFSMAGNGMAAARGFNAVPNNPANLGFANNPSFSLNALTIGGASGLSPVKFNDIANYGGKIIPATVKEEWLQAIGSGNERGGADGGVTVLALSVGHFGFQLGGVGTGTMNLNQDAAEALLFGNAGRTGTARSFNFSGSNASGSLFGVGAASVGIPVFSSGGTELALGLTGKYVVGGGAARAMDNGSTVTPDNINVRFPTIYTDSAFVGDAGSGFGVDLGLSWTNGSTTVAATARNVVNTFAWKTSAFRASVETFTFDGTTSQSNFDQAPYSAAPASMRSALEAEKFKPEVAVAVSRQLGDLLVAADGRTRLGDGIDIGPRMHVGAGVEYTGLSVLVLRGGAAAVTDGFQVAGGLGLRLGSYEFGAGVSSRSRSGGQDLGVMLSLVSIQ